MLNFDDLLEKDGLYYEINSDVPFTGEVTGSVVGNFKNGKPEGEWIEYYENGGLLSKGNYKNGELDGEFLYYYENGQLKEKGNFKDGKKEGEYLNYYQNGQLKRTEIYKDGELIKTIQP